MTRKSGFSDTGRQGLKYQWRKRIIRFRIGFLTSFPRRVKVRRAMCEEAHPHFLPQDHSQGKSNFNGPLAIKKLRFRVT